VFAASLCFYLLTAGGHLYTADDWAKFKVTESLVQRGGVEVPREPHVYGIPGRDGMWVSIFPVGTSLAAVPFYLAGRVIPVHGAHARDLVLRGSVSLVNQFVVAAMCMLLFLAVHEVCSDGRRALLTTAGFAVGTMAWPYAKHFWSEPAAALCVLGATLVLWRRSSLRPREGFTAGMLCGLAVLFKYESALLFAGVLYWIVRQSRSRRCRAAVLGSWAAGLLLAAAPTLWYNRARFGSVWQVAYGGDVGAEAAGALAGGAARLSAGLRDLGLRLVGPGRGLLWYNLPLAAAAAGCLTFVRRRPAYMWFLVLTLVPLPVFLALTGRSATWAWGPRLLFPLVVFAIVPAAFAPRWLKPAVICGVAINVGAVAVNFHDAIEALRDRGGFDGWEWTEAVDTKVRYSPILWHFRLLGPYTGRTIENLAHHSRNVGRQGGLDDYTVDMRKDSLDLVWFVLASAGAPLSLVLSAVVALGATSLWAARLAERLVA
jgi:hypothetical protein